MVEATNQQSESLLYEKLEQTETLADYFLVIGYEENELAALFEKNPTPRALLKAFDEL